MIDKIAAARAIEDFLRAMGHEPSGELAGTGARVADAWADDLLQGYAVDPAEILRASSIEAGEQGDTRNVVVLRALAVTTMCPHHLLPAHGTGLVAYIPGARLAGIGAIAHVVDAFARRLTLQESIGAEVADILVRDLGARGALCKLSLTHMCMIARGERKTGAIVETLATAGSFTRSTEDRALAFAAIGASVEVPG